MTMTVHPDRPAGAAAPVDDVLAVLMAKMAELIEVPLAEIDPRESLIDIGADSLVLMEAIAFLEDRYGIRLRARQILEELTTLELLAAHIARPVRPSAPSTDRAMPPDEESLRGDRDGPTASAPREPAPQSTVRDPVTSSVNDHRIDGQADAFVGWMPTEQPAEARSRTGDPSPRLVEDFGRRLVASKDHADRYRGTHCDPRSVASFRDPIKEVVVPVVASRAQGSSLWDIGGNEYLDMAMGFGSLLFGHGHPPIQVAVEQQLKALMGVGPVSYLAGPLSEEICRLTGQERAAFVTTGTEAMMLAVRLARATTGRRRVATFRGSYHGWWDGSLSLPGPTPGSAVSAVGGSIGSPPDDLLLLPWADDAALQILEEAGDSLAAIVVEPVQSRRPDCHPQSFLAELRHLATRHGAVLVFDEMITGFRLAPGGAAERFGVHPDICAYGKALGGGLPIGCVAGSSALLDALDGGPWRYGDGSKPRIPTTFGAGTFAKHPLSMAAAWTVVQEIERLGADLHDQLERRSARLQDEVDEVLRRHDVPAQLGRCGSMMRFISRRNLDAFFAGLIRHGCYLWEGRTMFLSWAHDDADVDRFVECCERAAGELPSSAPNRGASGIASAGVDAAPVDPEQRPPEPLVELPLTPNQRQLAFAYRSGSSVAQGFHNVAVLDLEGRVDIAALAGAVDEVARRHDGIRSTFDLEREVEIVHRHPLVALDRSMPRDLQSPADRRRWTDELVERCCTEPFDLERGPLWRVHLVQETSTCSKLVLACSDLVADGVSLGIVLTELAAFYEARTGGRAASLPSPCSLTAVREWLGSAEHQQHQAEALDYWRRELEGVDPSPALPPTWGQVDTSYFKTRSKGVIDLRSVERLDRLGRQHGVTRVSVLLTAFAALVHRVGGRNDIVIGMPTSGRGSSRLRHAVASLATPVAVRVRIDPETTFAALLPEVQRRILDAVDHAVPIDLLARERAVKTGRLDLLTPVMFNLDPIPQIPPFSDGVLMKIGTPERTFGLVPFSAEMCPTNDGSLSLSFDAAESMYDPEMVQAWAGYYLGLLDDLPDLSEAPVGRFPLRSDA